MTRFGFDRETWLPFEAADVGFSGHGPRHRVRCESGREFIAADADPIHGIDYLLSPVARLPSECVGIWVPRLRDLSTAWPSSGRRGWSRELGRLLGRLSIALFAGRGRFDGDGAAFGLLSVNAAVESVGDSAWPLARGGSTVRVYGPSAEVLRRKLLKADGTPAFPAFLSGGKAFREGLAMACVEAAECRKGLTGAPRALLAWSPPLPVPPILRLFLSLGCGPMLRGGKARVRAIDVKRAGLDSGAVEPGRASDDVPSPPGAASLLSRAGRASRRLLDWEADRLRGTEGKPTTHRAYAVRAAVAATDLDALPGGPAMRRLLGRPDIAWERIISVAPATPGPRRHITGGGGVVDDDGLVLPACDATKAITIDASHGDAR